MTRGPDPYPVKVRGQTFASVRECAEYFGILSCSVYKALTLGREDKIGLGKARPNNINHKMCREKPLTIGGMMFSSRNQAAKALGYSSTQALNQARRDRPHIVLQRAMRIVAEQEAERREKERKKNA